MKYLALVIMLVMVGCSGGGSDSPVSSSPPGSQGLISVTSLAVSPQELTWSRTYTLDIGLTNTYTSNKSVRIDLSRYDGYWATTTIFSSQTHILTPGASSIQLLAGTNLWEWGYDDRPAFNTLTFTTTIDGVSTTATVKLNGRFISSAG